MKQPTKFRDYCDVCGRPMDECACEDDELKQKSKKLPSLLRNLQRALVEAELAMLDVADISLSLEPEKAKLLEKLASHIINKSRRGT